MRTLLLQGGIVFPQSTKYARQTQASKLLSPRTLGGSRQSSLVVRADADGVYDVVAAARAKAGSPTALKPKLQQLDFITKLKAAWRIFFPPAPEKLSPKEAGKSRLRMILVADRCGMNQSSMYEMRHSIVKAVSDYVEIEAEDMVEVNVTSEPDMGTVYCVAVPIRRVKPQARLPMGADDADSDGITLMWDADDMGSDPSDRFPFGC